MVTLILIFIFFSPRVINFNDKPISRNPHPTEVVVTTDMDGRLFFQVTAGAVTPGDDRSTREQLLHIIEPIAGAVSNSPALLTGAALAARPGPGA